VLLVAGCGGEGAVAWETVATTAGPIVEPTTRVRDVPGGRLVVVSPGPRSSTGYDVAIREVVRDGDRIVIRAHEIRPGLNDPARPRVRAPYRVVRIPAGDEPVRVEWENVG
jgi:hypothetical protein